MVYSLSMVTSFFSQTTTLSCTTASERHYFMFTPCILKSCEKDSSPEGREIKNNYTTEREDKLSKKLARSFATNGETSISNELS
jgi:hypothetical protein